MLLSGLPLVAETLDEAKKSFTGQLEKIDAGYREERAKLGNQLLAALGKNRETAKSVGDLDLVKALDAEMERWKKEEKPPLVPSERAEIAKLHDLYEKTVSELKLKEQRAMLSSHESYEKRLSQMEKGFVTEDKIKEAEEIRSERDATSESLAIKDAREAVAKADANMVKPAAQRPVPAPALEDAPWKSLKKIKKFTADGSKWFLKGLGPEIKDLVGSRKTLKAAGEEYRFSEIIFTHASGRLTYTFDDPITEFRGRVCLNEGSVGFKKGNVIFKIETEEGEVFKSQEIKYGNNKEDVHVKFKPTHKLSLIIDQNGNDSEDWGFWANPEYR